MNKIDNISNQSCKKCGSKSRPGFVYCDECLELYNRKPHPTNDIPTKITEERVPSQGVFTAPGPSIKEFIIGWGLALLGLFVVLIILGKLGLLKRYDGTPDNIKNRIYEDKKRCGAFTKELVPVYVGSNNGDNYPATVDFESGHPERINFNNGGSVDLKYGGGNLDRTFDFSAEDMDGNSWEINYSGDCR